mmetsp:Transcript_53892/g.166997  ORF Transcript_53892/g.166997 Transcript_53892/m.166997 type:complete len:332 (+) Transcript_53892:89-1084(+)|eukprot:CAMPEP_0204561228 /NCGR_PEP_ID=MMETSP0661-20131031/33065_1 /ASSEMBLY_ACC=CAM_ASM_000606 /TAXON_ID=109239 /ORGANISM="Alexandrium margalefi, Strain AMGDE01CS-322" /LENGTH=331 /DNA_ID=CAMNT_0051568629 /DNA_START=89 /DNA_END=1084 /DNA_ORIENTATION=+
MEADASTALGPSSCALGPHSIGMLDARHLCTASFSSASIYYPESDGSQLPSIVIVGGWGCGEQVVAAWAPFYASHGIVAMTIGTPTPWKNLPPDRCQALLDASSALQSENVRVGSVLQGRLDVSSRAVQGYSLGGGGAQLAALKDQTLKCIIALCPDDGKDLGSVFPTELSASVPVLIICGEKDTDANVKTQAWSHYRLTGATKLIFEVAGGDHYVANGPAGGTESDIDQGACQGLCALCNCACVICMCMVCPRQLWCVPCPYGTLSGSSGHAKDHAPRGAVGGVALAWLQLFLLGDENARSKLAICPGIGSGFESNGVVTAPAMEIMSTA